MFIIPEAASRKYAEAPTSIRPATLVVSSAELNVLSAFIEEGTVGDSISASTVRE